MLVVGSGSGWANRIARLCGWSSGKVALSKAIEETSYIGTTESWFHFVKSGQSNVSLVKRRRFSENDPFDRILVLALSKRS